MLLLSACVGQEQVLGDKWDNPDLETFPGNVWGRTRRWGAELVSSLCLTLGPLSLSRPRGSPVCWKWEPERVLQLILNGSWMALASEGSYFNNFLGLFQ